MNIEVEVRVILSKEEYARVLKFLHEHAKFTREEMQTTYYYEASVDIRIQKSSSYAKIWMKKGVIHDQQREEYEVKTAPENFEKLEQIFEQLGFEISIKWFRKRLDFQWGDIAVSLDDTKGYELILELEKMADRQTEKETSLYLKQKLEELGLQPTPKNEFDSKYAHYKKHWRRLTQNL